MTKRIHGRGPALLALALPVLVGIAYLYAAGAPNTYLITNFGALIAAALWIYTGAIPAAITRRRAIAAGLLVFLFVPLITGPHISGIARWLPVGPLTVHAGALCLPALAMLAAQDDDYGVLMLSAALLAAMLQPDAAIGFAIVFAAAGLHEVTRDWRAGTVCIIGFFAAIIMALNGELPPQPLVERVLVDAAIRDPVTAMCLFLALISSFALILFLIPLPKTARYALAGSLFGFSIIAIMSNYPSILIGYGAAPILGYGLALGLCSSDDSFAQAD